MKKKAYGTYDIAKFCHVMPSTIGRWIEEGKLPSFTTGGGHRRVWATDLLTFLRSHNIPVPPELSGEARLTILIVDDEASIRRAVRKIIALHFPDVDVQDAEDGFEAGHKISTLLPSLVILDLRLPGLNGFKVCQMIREDKQLKSTKVLALTGYSPEEAKKEILRVGADDFLAKPFDTEDLVSKIQKLIHLAPDNLAKRAKARAVRSAENAG